MSRLWPALLAGVFVLAGCASPPRDPAALAIYRANNDPLEPMNRRIFAFNDRFDRAVAKPVAKVYVRLLPDLARRGIRNFFRNLGEPVIFANDALQGQLTRAGKTAGRFVVNSTVGAIGFVDVATERGWPRDVADFGQTLHAWGFPEGPYLILPILGPTNPRDGIGTGVDIYMDPFRYVARNNHYPTAWSVGYQVIPRVDERAQAIDIIDELQREAVDFYASFRSLYRQNRQAELRHNQPLPPAKSDDLYSDPGDAAPGPH